MPRPYMPHPYTTRPFLLCDDGSREQFGREIPLRASFEAEMVRTKFHGEVATMPVFDSLSRIFTGTEHDSSIHDPSIQDSPIHDPSI